MSKYEVFLPPAREGDFNLTLRVDADNWMAALKAGLKKLGEQGSQVSNLMVDIMEDNSIHVTDSASGRVFRIKELEQPAEPTKAEPIPLAQPVPIPLSQPAPIPLSVAVPPPPDATMPGSDLPTPKEMPAVEPPPPEPAPRAAAKSASKPAAAKPAPKPAPAKPAPVAAKAAPKAPEKAKPPEKPAAKPAPVAAKAAPLPLRDTAEAKNVEQMERPSQPISGPIGRTKSSMHIEEILADLFERTQDAFSLAREEGLAFLLDLALEKIPAESGSVFVADFASTDLELSDARGPKAQELKRMKLRMPVGVGIVGFCAQEAVSVAISDTEKDPRFYKDVSDKLGYATRSILCAPMVKGGRTFGCLEVNNKKGSSHFTDSELAILAYVAHQGAAYLEQITV